MGNKKIIVKLLKRKNKNIKLAKWEGDLIKTDLDKNKLQQFNKKWLNSHNKIARMNELVLVTGA